LRITQPAQPASIPTRPHVLLNIGTGTLAGFFLGLMLALLLERVDTRVRTVKELKQLLSWPNLIADQQSGSAKKSEPDAHAVAISLQTEFSESAEQNT
jgi:capsular polysaccharide biosynthesis protein